ncbi:hypothetical protein [Chitinophaga lutea]|uniref:hypothetical protein n=1 Tax=Chitinophaga lutea TaxID=2488634 RepID=UPI0013159482|nr:hypothetical protein [Chitinophaga lutea]
MKKTLTNAMIWYAYAMSSKETIQHLISLPDGVSAHKTYSVEGNFNDQNILKSLDLDFG